MQNNKLIQIFILIISFLSLGIVDARSQNFIDAVADAGTLPVELLRFTGSKTGGDVQLTWSTATESNSSHFFVQRSTNGTEFSNIGKVSGAGNTTTIQHYHFTDVNVAQGNLYYRLQQLDADGKWVYSSVVLIRSAGVKTEMTIYPNPVKDNNLRLTLSNVSNGKYTVELRNISGAKLFNHVYDISGTSANIQLSLDRKPAAGVYIVSITGAENFSIRQRIVIQ